MTETAALPPAEAGSRLMPLKRRAPSERIGHFSDISRAAALAATRQMPMVTAHCGTLSVIFVLASYALRTPHPTP